MNGRVFSFGKSGNPLAQILSVLVFGVMLVAALIMGAVVIAVLIGLAVILAVVLVVRTWWLRRKFRSHSPLESGYEPSDTHKRLIEGEYKVVKRPDAEDARRQP